MNYLVVQVSTVLVQVKPSVLICLPVSKRPCGVSFLEEWEKNKQEIIQDIGLSFLEMKTTSMGKQVLFYAQEKLQVELAKENRACFLEELGYSRKLSLKGYLNVLMERFNSGKFPHEIGIFLGYPVKDVKGFMCKEAFPLDRRTRWRIFGDLSISLNLMRLYEKVETIFKEMLNNGQDPLRAIDKLQVCFQVEVGNKKVRRIRGQERLNVAY